MPTGMINIVASIAGLSIQASRTRTASGQISHEVTIPAAKTGTLTTRTDDDEGIFTLAAGHGLVVDDVIDVYWAGGIRYGMKVSAVNGNDVTAGGVGGPGAGDVLPDQGTAVTVSKQVTVDTDFDGDKLEMIVVANTAQANTKRAHFDFQDSGGLSLKAQELAGADPWDWSADTSIANPLAGNPVDRVKLSNGDSAAAAQVKIGVLYNSDE
jgi:hypothetical protein